MSGEETMTRREREQLAQLVRRREKLAKADADKVAAERLADFEQQMATIYAAEDARWADLTKAANAAVTEANAGLEARCDELGIPEKFRPSLSLSWWNRGENASRERRAELRAVAKSRIDAMAKEAKVEIERQSVSVQTQLIAGGLESEEARAFLAAMPTAEALIGAAPSVAEIERVTPHRARFGRELRSLDM